MGWLDIFSFGSKLMDKLPIQNRVERYRNRLEKLKQERVLLLRGVADDKKVKRLVIVDNDIAKYTRLLGNRD